MKRRVGRALQKLRSKWRSPPPSAPIVPYSYSVHGETIEDPFRWMHELSEETHDYISRENEFYHHFFTQPQVQQYLQEIQQELRRGQEDPHDNSVPELVHGYYYYNRYSGGNFPILCRKKTLSAPENAFLDINAEGKGYEYISVRNTVVSPDQKILAFAKSTTGEDLYHGVIRTMDSKQVLSQLSSVYSMAFSADSRYIIYTVWLHRIGTEETQDRLVYHEKDDAFFLDVTITKDHKWILISGNAKQTSEVRLLDAEKIATSQPIVVQPRSSGVRYFLDHAEDTFFCVTDRDGAHNFKLLTAKASEMLPALQNTSSSPIPWREMVPHSETLSINDVDVFQNHIVLYVTEDACQKIYVYDQRNITAEPYQVPLPSDYGSVEPGANSDYMTTMLRFSFSSPIHPTMVYDLNMADKDLTLRKETRYEDYNPEHYSCDRVNVPVPASHSVPGNPPFSGAVDVPMILTRHRAAPQPVTESPILLNVYGAYGNPIEPCFRSKYRPLWKRGWTVGTVYARGGGEKGTLWHRYGSGPYKWNSINDFIGCATYVRDNQLAHPNQLFASGVSAGGIILGAAFNNHPELFKAIMMKVPFVDCLSSMLDESLPLTICEYPEWGNPTESKEAFDTIRSYDPYLNMKSKHSTSPSVYVTTSTVDYQVPFWGPLKWMARLRNGKGYSEKKTAICAIDESAGHQGDGGRVSGTSSVARELAFFLYHGNRTKTNK